MILMTAQSWNKLSLFEQLSNVAGDVGRLVSTRENKMQGKSKEDFSGFYLNKIRVLVDMTIADPKNKGRASELLDEIKEIERYENGEVPKEYILRYWNQYTMAIS